jgi:uncharacterized Fe-S center protein
MSERIPRVSYLPIEKAEGRLMELVTSVGFQRIARTGQRAGIKVHFGEEGNRGFVPPKYAAEVISGLKELGVEPVLVETTTLYRSPRQTGESHIELAHHHGFNPEAVGADIRILDGERGEESVERTVNLDFFDSVQIAKGVLDLDLLVCISHFKGHMVTGFGGAIKNLGMGLSASSGKLEMHSLASPYVKKDKCTSCGLCAENCPRDAISVDEKAKISNEECIGCCQCLSVCSEGAISIRWSEVSENVSRKMVEYAMGAVQGLSSVYLNFLINITPNCDCLSTKEPPFHPDVGVFASLDPVACDQACYERIADGLKVVWPKLAPEVQLEHGERVGLGRRKYELIEL